MTILQIDMSDKFLSLSGMNSILGRSVVVHADQVLDSIENILALDYG